MQIFKPLKNKLFLGQKSSLKNLNQAVTEKNIRKLLLDERPLKSIVNIFLLNKRCQ